MYGNSHTRLLPPDGFVRGFKKGCATDGGKTQDEIRQEISDYFDAHWDGNVILKIAQASGYRVSDSGHLKDEKKDEVRENFVKKLMRDLQS
jgi:hypothetical protein